MSQAASVRARRPRSLRQPALPTPPQALEERNRALEEEVGELRQLQDAAAEAGDIRELQRELRVGWIFAGPWAWLVVCVSLRTAPLPALGPASMGGAAIS